MLFYGDDREEHVLLAQETERSMYIIFALDYSNGETLSLSLSFSSLSRYSVHVGLLSEDRIRV